MSVGYKNDTFSLIIMHHYPHYCNESMVVLHVHTYSIMEKNNIVTEYRSAGQKMFADKIPKSKVITSRLKVKSSKSLNSVDVRY